MWLLSAVILLDGSARTSAAVRRLPISTNTKKRLSKTKLFTNSLILAKKRSVNPIQHETIRRKQNEFAICFVCLHGLIQV